MKNKNDSLISARKKNIRVDKKERKIQNAILIYEKTYSNIIMEGGGG